MYFMIRLYHELDLLDTVTYSVFSSFVPEIHVVLSIPPQAEGVDDLSRAGVDHVPDHSFPTSSSRTLCFIQAVFDFPLSIPYAAIVFRL